MTGGATGEGSSPPDAKGTVLHAQGERGRYRTVTNYPVPPAPQGTVVRTSRYNGPNFPRARRMANLYHVPGLPDAGEATITGDVAHHLLRVLRMREGDQIVLGDGRGRTARATIRQAGKRELVAAVEPAIVHRPVRPGVTVAFACPRPARTDWLIEHGTEIGVARFQPLWTTRSRPQALRADRWRKIAAAAAGQCARPFLPEVREPLELAAFLATELPSCRLLADAGGTVLDGAGEADAAVLLVGPEGGFGEQERADALGHGFAAVRFGPHILRTETAALLGAAVLLRAAT